MNSIRLQRALFLLLLISVPTVSARTTVAPDQRPWEQVTADFIARSGNHRNEGFRDGRRLKELDAKRAVAFLTPFLAKDVPFGLRIEAIGALGGASFQEAIPALSAIAMDVSDNHQVRTAALTSGLRSMNNPQAVQPAFALTADKILSVRAAAYLMLGESGTDKAFAVLEEQLRSNDRPELLNTLISALTTTNNPRAGKVVFKQCNFSTIQPDEDFLCIYSIVMKRDRVSDAQENMLRIAKQVNHPLSAYYALQYFSLFPREDVVPALIAYLEDLTANNNLSETVSQFITSPNITAESKKKLSLFTATGKIKKSEPLVPQ